MKTGIQRRLTFENRKDWESVLQATVKSLNETKLPSLNYLSPAEALKEKNIPKLQLFYLKRRAIRAKKFKEKKPLKLGTAVKVAITQKFKNRGFKPRWGGVHYVTKVLDNSIPTVYYVSSFGTRIFYRNQLLEIENLKQLESSLVNKKLILTIMKDKLFAVKFLKSGKPIDWERKYLVKTSDSDENHYLFENEIMLYENGPDKLKAYREKKDV